MQNNSDQKCRILAEVLLANLPNNFCINAGSRRYKNELAMLSETADAKQVVIPVSAILDYLSQNYKQQNKTIKEDIVDSVGRLLEDIYKETGEKRMLGFDGVCFYLKSKIDKDKAYVFNETDQELKNIKEVELVNHNDDLTYYVKHPLVDPTVIETMELYKKDYKDQTIDAIEIIKEYNKQVVQAINEETIDRSKYCDYCIYSLNKCKFISNFEHKRRPSFEYNDSFRDLKNSSNTINVDSKEDCFSIFS